MNDTSATEAIKVISIDLAKSSFHLHGVDAGGNTVLRKKVFGEKLKSLMVNMPPCLVAMEACGSAHYWARTFVGYGHEVRLIAPVRQTLRQVQQERFGGCRGDL